MSHLTQAALQQLLTKDHLSRPEVKNLIATARSHEDLLCRLSAFEVIYLKTAGDKSRCIQRICEYIALPGLGAEHVEGSDLIRERALSILVEHRNTMPLHNAAVLDTIRHLMNEDAYQTVRSAAAVCLYFRSDSDQDKWDAVQTLKSLAKYDGYVEVEKDRWLIQQSARIRLAMVDSYLEKLPTHPKHYERSYGAKYGGFILKTQTNGNFVFTKDEVMSCITQAMHGLSRSARIKGAFTFKDNDLLRPKGLFDYMTIAAAVEPEIPVTPIMPPPSQGLNGYKIDIGGRLIVVLHQTNRYVYDCGELAKWQAHFGKLFTSMTAEDIYFVRSVCMALKKDIKANKAHGDPRVLIREYIEAFNKTESKHFKKYKFNPDHADNLYDFFVDEGLDCSADVSYREIMLGMTREILASGYSDADVSTQFRELICGNPLSKTLLTNMPIFIAATLVSEQGRCYSSIPVVCMLIELIESQSNLKATGAPLTWLDSVVSSEIYKLTHMKPADKPKNVRKKISSLATTAGYFPMTHEGSFKDNVPFPPKKGEEFAHGANVRALQHVLAGQNWSSRLLGPKMHWLLSQMKEAVEQDKVTRKSTVDASFFKPMGNKPNLNKNKTMLIISEWLLKNAKAFGFKGVTILSESQTKAELNKKGLKVGSLGEFMEYIFEHITFMLDPTWRHQDATSAGVTSALVWERFKPFDASSDDPEYKGEVEEKELKA